MVEPVEQVVEPVETTVGCTGSRVVAVWYRRLQVALAALAVAVGAGACSATGAAGGVSPDAYVAALAAFLPEPPHDGDDDGDLPVAYVASLGESPLALDAQVAVIDGLADRCDLRFVDSPGAAIDDDTDGAPPRDKGILLAIGTILADPPHTVRVEEYLDAGHTAAHLVTLVERAGAWTVTGIDGVDPEVLVGDG